MHSKGLSDSCMSKVKRCRGWRRDGRGRRVTESGRGGGKRDVKMANVTVIVVVVVLIIKHTYTHDAWGWGEGGGHYLQLDWNWRSRGMDGEMEEGGWGEQMASCILSLASYIFNASCTWGRRIPPHRPALQSD